MEENLRAAVSLPYFILLKLENKTFSDLSCLHVRWADTSSASTLPTFDLSRGSARQSRPEWEENGFEAPRRRGLTTPRSIGWSRFRHA